MIVSNMNTAPRAVASSSAKRALGARGEAIAAKRLELDGYVILDRNWRCRDGELDLVVRDGKRIIAVEVKTRSGLGYGHPLAAITPAKLRRLRKLLHAWVHAHDVKPSGLRVDAIGITLRGGERPSVEHVMGLR